MAAVWSDIVGGTHGAALDEPDWEPDATLIQTTAGSLTVRTSGGVFGATKHVDEIATSASGVAYSSDDVTATDAYAIARELVIVTAPSAEIPILWAGAGTARNVMVALVVESGTVRLRVRDAANTAKWTASPLVNASPALPEGTRLLVSLYSARHPSSGTYRVVAYNLDDDNAIVADSGLQTGQNTGSGSTTRVRRGPKCSTGAQTVELEGAGFAFDGAATDVITPRSDDDPPTLVIDQPVPGVIDLTGSTAGDGSTALTYATPVLVSGPALTRHDLAAGIYAFEQDTGDTDSVYTFGVEQDDEQTDSANETIPVIAYTAINIAAPLSPTGTVPGTGWG